MRALSMDDIRTNSFAEACTTSQRLHYVANAFQVGFPRDAAGHTLGLDKKAGLLQILHNKERGANARATTRLSTQMSKPSQIRPLSLNAPSWSGRKSARRRAMHLRRDLDHIFPKPPFSAFVVCALLVWSGKKLL